MLESSFSRVRFVYLVQGKDWSSVGKLIFKSSIRFLGSGQRLIECWEAHFQEFDSFSWFRARTDRMLENSFSRVRFVFLVQGKDRSNVGKLVFKSSIRLLCSGQRLIECWKARFQEFDSFTWFRATTESKRIELLKTSFPTFDRSLPWTKKTNRTLENEFSNIRYFQEFDSFSWFRATTDRMLESSFSRVRFVFLVQGNNWSNVGKLVFKSSIRFLGSGQGLIECWKARFQEFDSFSWFRATTDRMLESSFSRVRFIYLVQGNDWRKRIEFLKTSFPTFDQSLPWTKKTNRTLENELSNIRSVVALNQENESNSWKWAFQHSISRCPEPSKWIELLKMSFPTFDQSLPWTIERWKARFQEFDSFSWFRATIDRALESSFSRVRFVSLVQSNDWSSVGKLIFKSSIRFLGSGQRLIERWKAHFQEFDSFSWFRATTDRMLESSFSRVRFVFLVQGNDWRKRIELLKMSFPTLDQSLPWTKKTNRTLENELSNIRSVVALNQENESNSWKRAFQHSISRCPEPRKRIELLKMSFPTFDQSLPWTKKTNRTLENELSNTRSVLALNQENKSNSWKRAFQHSISRCPEPRKRIELLKTSFPTFDQSLPWTIECWKTHFQEFDSFSWFRATTDRMLESSFSRVRFVYLVQGKDRLNVGKLVFKSSIRFLGSGQRPIECWKARFQEFDSFSWFRATTDRMLESSFSRVRFVFLVQGNDWSNVGKLIFKSSIRLLGWGQRLIERWKAHFQEFDSFSWFRETTDRALESSFSRVWFVFLVQGNDWSNVGKLVFKSSIRLLGSGQRLIECWKARFQEFD